MPPLHLDVGTTVQARARVTRGFTLVEVLCAAAVFMAGFAGIIASDLATSNFASRARHQAMATEIATSMVNLGQMLPAADLLQLNSGSTSNFGIDGKLVGQTGGATFYTAKAKAINFSQGSTTLPCIQVVVQWAEPYARSARTVQLEGCPPPL